MEARNASFVSTAKNSHSRNSDASRRDSIPELAPTSSSFALGRQKGASIFIMCCVGMIIDVRVSRSYVRQCSTVSNGSFRKTRCSRSKIRLRGCMSKLLRSVSYLPLQDFGACGRGLRKPIVSIGIECLAHVVDVEPALLELYLERIVGERDQVFLDQIVDLVREDVVEIDTVSAFVVSALHTQKLKSKDQAPAAALVFVSVRAHRHGELAGIDEIDVAVDIRLIQIHVMVEKSVPTRAEGHEISAFIPDMRQVIREIESGSVQAHVASVALRIDRVSLDAQVVPFFRHWPAKVVVRHSDVPVGKDLIEEVPIHLVGGLAGGTDRSKSTLYPEKGFGSG